MRDRKTVLVTGAGGFMGGRIIETLSLTGAARARAGMKKWSGAARVARFPVDIVLCDVMDPEQIASAMEGVSHVVHCAAGSSEVIEHGTRNMVEVARQLGVERFVHISTAEVYGNPSGTVDETCALEYTSKEYANAKINAEKAVWHAADSGLSATVFRPSIVYGPYSKKWTVGMAERLMSGRWGTFGQTGEGICNLVYIDDLVSAILTALDHPNAEGQAFNINGSETVTWNDYFHKFNEAMGLPELGEITPDSAKRKSDMTDRLRSANREILKRFREPIMKLADRSDRLKQWMKQYQKSVQFPPTPADLILFSRRAFYAPEKAHHLLDYRPRIDLNTGLQLTTAWLRHQWFLPDHS